MRLLLPACLLLGSICAHAYSVLSHEAIVDSEWTNNIVPVIEARFGKQRPEVLRDARAYAYGGCVIQDMGYYPLSSRFFSDLVHYVRSGDFVESLIRQARDVNELAFALGAMAHYSSDNIGHYATNHAVPILYPKKQREFGNVITYAQYPLGHIQVEFSFDVLQVARGRYAPETLHDFIGFEISKELLERSFAQVYGIELKDIFPSLDLAIGTYRFTVSKLIPEMTKVALAAHENQIQRSRPYTYSRKQFEKEYGQKYQRPGWFARFLAHVLRFMPPVGPFRALAFRPPTPVVEQMFTKSFEEVEAKYARSLKQVQAHTLRLQNTNLDDGKPTAPGEYIYADRAYSTLVRKIAEMNPDSIPKTLRADVLHFFAERPAHKSSKKDAEEWQKTQAAVEKLKTAVAVSRSI